ncbi:selenide water dikinase, putative [Plasmodium ovale wallikeri]|uniref:Selenide water dikinase, putative n=2 Tax=Plasmodium ovale TaxID=36330 RepID=A0A1A8YPJ0_PLAOA|nr:selenide water dikinase, putative [Plasmodium ovale wallikeri]SBT33753.1 selenide water dikinase, putative [Plasmodium ovale wallikeri]SBT76300.1 selenide water dikinase, putative [Plasmodium ovale]
MRICKKIDPVIDIVLIGFGKRSKVFIDLFLEKSEELKGVNIIVICKDNFVFLNSYLQCIEVCKDTYIDVYKYCKERNILYINEKIECIDSNKKIIYFSSDRNNLSYDFLLLDFDYKSGYLLNRDLSHMNIYPYRNKNLFFYFVHIMYLSLLKWQNGQTSNIKEYYKWKSFFLKSITVQRFYNFFSYNDKYVEEIFDIYDAAYVSRDSPNEENSVRVDMHVGEEIVRTSSEEVTTNGEVAAKGDPLKLVLLSDDHRLGKGLYFAISENVKKHSAHTKIVYVYITTELDVDIVDFCDDYVVITSVEEVLSRDDDKVIKCIDKKGEMITIQYDECINVTDLKYPTYMYNSKLDEQITLSINSFCQHEKYDTLYFLNQVRNYDDFTICHTVYVNICNNINKREYISIEHVQKKKDVNNTPNIFYTNAGFYIAIKNYMYSTISEIAKKCFSNINNNTFVQKKIYQLMEKKKEIDKYIEENKVENSEMNSFPFLINFLFFLHKKIVIYFDFVKRKFSFNWKEKVACSKRRDETHDFKDNSSTHCDTSRSGSNSSCNVSRNGSEDSSNAIRTDRESISRISALAATTNRCDRNGGIGVVGSTGCDTGLSSYAGNTLPVYMYDMYLREYEKRLIVSKKTTYRISQMGETKGGITPYGDTSSGLIVIVQDEDSKCGNVANISSTEKVNLYIRESIEKIINRNTCGGCGSKVPSNILSNSLKSLNIYNSPNVYLGVEGTDDCCVFVHSKSKMGEESPALVQTIDFFKSFIDDEYILGEIIAIHSLSDIYSMGGIGICALCVLIVKDNIEKKLQQRLENILTGCCQKLKEEKCVLSGGHTCAGNENYVGLAVTGKIKKKKGRRVEHAHMETLQVDKLRNKDIRGNDNCSGKISPSYHSSDVFSSEENVSYDQEDKEKMEQFKKHELLIDNYLFLPKGSKKVQVSDVIITTKIYGFGFIMAAHICKKAKARWIYNCLDEMLISNRKSGLYFLKKNVKACTDVTGFGILGHLNEMIKCSRREIYLNCKMRDAERVEARGDKEEGKTTGWDNTSDKVDTPLNFIGAKINLNNIKIAEGVQDCIEKNIYSSMYKKNHYLCNNIINLEEAMASEKYGILFDPQTSGGLMAIVAREEANNVILDLQTLGYKNAAIIGEIIHVQYDKYKNMSIKDISLSDYLDTTNSVYVEC